MNPVGSTPADHTWWVELFLSSGSCVLVGGSADEESAAIAESRYSRFGIFGPRNPLYLVLSEATSWATARP